MNVGRRTATRRRFDRAPWDSRSYREYRSREARYDRYDRRFDRPTDPSELDQDFAAMKRVWQMLRAGAVRMVGEIGRQY